ncbi:Hypothetical protein HVR_LOCUS803 [uncultured virus]|nr:Hypothetical protein HVR_LOCUS803 [uncultured virus]
MGYDYYILIQGLKEGKWVKVEYHHYGGSYSDILNHYFINETQVVPKYDEVHEFPDPMGKHHYIFSYETLKADHAKHHPQVNVDTVKDHLTQVLNEELTIDSIKKLHTYLGDSLESQTNAYAPDGLIEELNIYYEKCTKAHAYYDEVRLIFGVCY